MTSLAPRILISPDPTAEISLSFGVTPTQTDIDYILELPEKIAMENNSKIIICIDEFQQIGEYPDSTHFQRVLRSHWQNHNNASYCLFGSKRHMMMELFEKSSNPFFKFGDLINLKKIDRQHWIKFIIERFETENLHINTEIAEKICELTDDYSSYVQQLSWLLWINFDEKNQEEALEKSYRELLDQSSILFEQQTQNLTAYQMNFLKAIIEGVKKDFSKSEIISKYNLGSPGNISRLKDALIKKELIEYIEGEYQLTDPVLKEWLRRKIL